MSDTKIVGIDGKLWHSKADFYDALAEGLGSFDGHGRNADAFLETMIFNLDLNEVQPPYRVVIANAPDGLHGFLGQFARWIAEARTERLNDPEWGDDVEVTMVIQ